MPLAVVVGAGMIIGAAQAFRLAADAVILATGTATPVPLDVPLPVTSHPGLILRTRPRPPLIRHVLVSPQMEFRQDALGCLLAPTDAGHQGQYNRHDLRPAGGCGRCGAVAAAPASSAGARRGPRCVWQTGRCLGIRALSWAGLQSGVTLATEVADLLAAGISGQSIAPAPAGFRHDRLIRRRAAG